MNSFGNIFRLTSFGESHGEAIGGVIDGCPPLINADTDFIQRELDRRKPGQSDLTTSRNETDRIELLSGVFEGKTTGAPIGFIVRNTDAHSSDYDNLRNTYRPSHADFTYQQKYGIRDHRGGGRSSARETVARIVGGAFAKLVMQQETSMEIKAWTSQAGHIVLKEHYSKLNMNQIETNPVRCPDPETAEQMEALIRTAKAEGDTVGGVITCVCTGVPRGLGEPVFNKLHAALGAAMLSINAAKGFDCGMGFDGASKRGSQMNDIFCRKDREDITVRTNHSGGIQGGISNGEDIVFRVAFKPVATLLQKQQTVDINGEETLLTIKGRHDACVLPRAVPIVEAMAAMTLVDFFLLAKTWSKDIF
ncbi:MAG: chorismate synthase [Dysgonamonadaceae bacterium]|jgi:chorismate synthase|nr:chorismate synthase [Dysgonamonadaceae bacterium]